MSEITLPPTTGLIAEPVLQQRLTLLEKRNEFLFNELIAARRYVARMEGLDPQQVMDELIEQLNRLPGLSEEEPDPAQEEATPEEQESESAEKKKRGHGPRSQPNLPIVDRVYDLEPSERNCDVCGGEMTPLGEQFEEHEEISVVQLQYVRKKVKRKKYRCKCNACVKTAQAPPRLIPGGRYDLDFALHVAENKYLDHLPLERQCRRMARFGLVVTSQTLWDQILALSRLLRPIYSSLGEKVLESPVLHADETRWPLLDGKRVAPWFVWTRNTSEIVHFTILSTKSSKAARRLFSGFHGTIVADGFQVYDKLAKENSRLEIANCWAHVRRKFADIEENFPAQCAEILALIAELYAVEAKVGDSFPCDTESCALRARLRASESQAILEKIRYWAEVQVGLPRSDLGKAVKYMYKRWNSLTRFIDNPLIPLDNNAAERALRGPVVGRKNHYGSKSSEGTKVAAIFYTLFETAKLWGVNPAIYMKIAAERALASPGAVTFPWELGNLDQFLPGE